MQQLLVLVLLLVPAVPCLAIAQAQRGNKVLMIVTEAPSEDLKLALTKEAGLMKDLLQQAGFKVVVATASNQPLVAGTTTLRPDIKFSEVRIDQYEGVIVPCMGASAAPLPPDGMAIIKDAVAKGKPLAAQAGSVVLLARAGGLSGKKYAMGKGWTNPELKDGIHSGDGVVQDGKIITSGICPVSAKAAGLLDGTSKLTETLIAELKK